MGKVFKNVLLIILGAIFLLSFTGLRLLLHSCMGCSISEMHLFTLDENCCIGSEQTLAADYSCCAAAEAISCCSDALPDPDCSNCCEDELVYLINDYELLNSKSEIHIRTQLLAHLVGLSELMNYAPSQSSALLSANYYPPPPAYVGRAFVLFSHQIKIG